MPGGVHVCLLSACACGWVHLQGTEYPPPASLKKELIATVREEIGPIATPDVIHWAPGTHTARASSAQCTSITSARMLPVACSLPITLFHIREQGQARVRVCLRIAGLPKTRSGKIMRRILRKIASK